MAKNWGIYVHVPWCRRRCPYCDFYFEIGRVQSGYVQGIKEEFSKKRSSWPAQTASTLYFGGGTPSLMLAAQIDQFTGFLWDRKDLAQNAEITLEANPEDVKTGLPIDWRGAGINRVSLGVQSLNDNVLKDLGRKHRKADAMSAIESCLDSGLRVCVDLIVGVPGEDLRQIGDHVRILSEMGVTHLSGYLLTVEPGTSLEKMIRMGRRSPLDEDKQADAYEYLQMKISENGFRQYEISSYAIPGFESNHNRNYWGKGAYLGLGPGAHSMRFLEDGSLVRTHNPNSIVNWPSGPIQEEIILPEHAFLESVAFGLRDILEGVSLENLSKRHKCSIPPELHKVVEWAKNLGWVIEKSGSDGSIQLTKIGARFSDAIAREILALA